MGRCSVNADDILSLRIVYQDRYPQGTQSRAIARTKDRDKPRAIPDLTIPGAGSRTRE